MCSLIPVEGFSERDVVEEIAELESELASAAAKAVAGGKVRQRQQLKNGVCNGVGTPPPPPPERRQKRQQHPHQMSYANAVHRSAFLVDDALRRRRSGRRRNLEESDGSSEDGGGDGGGGEMGPAASGDVSCPLTPPMPTPPAAAMMNEPFLSAVYADCQVFGAGCCCLQSTFGCRNLEEATYLYDHFVVLGPLLLALTAATPCVKGTLTNFDTRWDLMSQTWDDRRNGENFSPSSSSAASRAVPRAVEIFENGRVGGATVSTSDEKSNGGRPGAEADSKVGFGRFYSPRVYTSEGIDTAELHDVPCSVHAEGYKLLRESGVPENLARHVSSLFVRDPLVVFEERIDLDDERDLDHWNSLNSTNWTTVRLKVPEREKGLPWRVEVRCPEIQMTDVKNAALVTLLYSLVRHLVQRRRRRQEAAEKEDQAGGDQSCGSSLLLPISLVDENMRRSAQRDAVTSQKYWWAGGEEGRYVEKMLHEILFDEEAGLLELAYRDLLRTMSDSGGDIPEKNVERLHRHFEIYRRRCRGELQTTAQFIRNFLREGADENRRVDLGRVRELAHLVEQMGLHPSTSTIPDALISHDLLLAMR